ncbi:uncharacterized protein N0V89_008136 [Didymosphaeria variabile]|uniref:SMP-30/Gluconolactonase/LRE-like region domain-containing protein n=1 Tax=Didymosphaeria variabile TaxID=1932322 RepID=A0A9W9C7I6_9PLEO|nr:uncharacterized protein N0V89_008136 [Didymosphaeria variabile]KAJ4349520.1 hypothetical protein N0V89_008136 [Didymosphaeria variabile]
MKLFLSATILSLASAAAVQKHGTVQQLATFPGFAENIAVRHNGHILVTSLSTPSIHYLNPARPNKTTLLQPIPGANGVSGIVELQKDIFAVAAGIWNTTARRETNASVWTVDFRHSSAHPTLRKIVNIPETTVLNGLTSIPGTSIVLASDSAVGAIYAINVKKHTHSIAIQDSVLAPTGPTPNLGVNGIKVHKSNLYFANSGTGVFGRFPITRSGKPTGPAETVSQFSGSVDSAIDDFVIDEHGNAYISFHPNTVFKVDSHSKQKVIVSGAQQIRDPTSVALGRGSKKGRKALYASVNILADPTVGGVDAIYL